MHFKWKQDQGRIKANLQLCYYSPKDPITGKAVQQTLSYTQDWRFCTQEELAKKLQAVVREAIRDYPEHRATLSSCPLFND